MKTSNFKRINQALMLILVFSLNACFQQSQFGDASFKTSKNQNAVALENSSLISATYNENVVAESDDSSEYISHYLSSTTTTRQLATGTTDSNSTDLSFIEEVDEARYEIDGSKLFISFYNNDFQSITVPEIYMSSSRFRDSGDYVLIDLSNGNQAIAVVIHKDSRKVFISKDTKLQNLDLDSSLETGSLKMNGTLHSAVKITAKDSTGNTIKVAISYIDQKMYAVKL